MDGNKSFMTSLLSLLDNDSFMKDALSKPCPGTEQVDVKYWLSVVEEILHQVMPNAHVAASAKPKEANPVLQGNQGQSRSFTSPSVDSLSSTINELCCEMTCKALQTSDVQKTMESLLHRLSSFSWAAKAVLMLLALSVNYAEKWHHAQLAESDNLSNLLANLRGLRTIGNSKAFVGLNRLIKVTLELTKSVEAVNYYVEFREFAPSIDISATFYQIIVIVLGCSVQLSGMISMSKEFLELDLSTFSDKVVKIYNSINQNVEVFKRKIEEHFLYEKIKEIYKNCNDIVELIAGLVCTKNSPTVYQCSQRKEVKVEYFKTKSVLLLISDLNLSNEDLAMLTNIYIASPLKSENYEILWVPIMEEWNEATEKQFRIRRSQMQWYTCNFMIRKVAAKFIQKKWQYRQQTKVVVLNQQGKVVNMDAMTMIRLWGGKAMPFTNSHCDQLWKSQGTNWFELVVNNIVFPNVEQSFIKKELIFLYGSAEDSKTVQDIEECLKKIKSSGISCIALNISTKREQFLTRFESCMASKMQVNSDIYDPLTQEMVKLYTNYKKQSGFAILAKASTVFVNARLTDFLTVLSQYHTWSKKVSQRQSFEAVFKEQYELIIKTRCHNFYVPNMVGNIPECIKCNECSRYMKTAVTFECCHDDH